MLIVLDTSSLIRFFTNDIPKKAATVKVLLEKEKNIYIPEVVFPELEYVLTEQYDTSRKQSLTIFQFLSSQRNIKVTPQVRKAVQIYEKSSLDIADCIIAAYSLKGSLASFDQDLLSIQGIRPFWK